MPAGAVMECTAHYDNSINNPENPDATKVVQLGEQSWDEMMNGFFDVAIDPKLDPEELLRKRSNSAPSTSF